MKRPFQNEMTNLNFLSTFFIQFCFMYIGWKKRNIFSWKNYIWAVDHTIFLFKKRDSFWGTQNCWLSLFQVLKYINLHTTHHSLSSALKWTSLVGSRQPSSSAWQCCGKGLPGRSTSFPSFFAGPCMPAHSHGTAGRNTRPEARNYSSMCSRTAKGQQGWFESCLGDMPPLQRVGKGRPPSMNWSGLPYATVLLAMSEN